MSAIRTITVSMPISNKKYAQYENNNCYTNAENPGRDGATTCNAGPGDCQGAAWVQQRRGQLPGRLRRYHGHRLLLRRYTCTSAVHDVTERYRACSLICTWKWWTVARSRSCGTSACLPGAPKSDVIFWSRSNYTKPISCLRHLIVTHIVTHISHVYRYSCSEIIVVNVRLQFQIRMKNGYYVIWICVRNRTALWSLQNQFGFPTLQKAMCQNKIVRTRVTCLWLH